MKTFLLVLALLMPVLPAHDFFVSICTLHHNAEDSTLEITWRMTTHDVEHALVPEAGRSLHLGGEMEVPEADSLLGAYLVKQLTLEQGNTSFTIRYLGKEVELENLYCYLQVDGVKDVEGLRVMNSLLFDMFAEQRNIVHVETNAGTLSHDFIPGSAPFTFTRPE